MRINPKKSLGLGLGVSLALLASGFGLSELAPQSSQAQPVPLARRSSSPWQSASFPVENFQAYTSGFGYRPNPTGEGTQFHNGLDLAAPMGSYVRNWWGGQITELSDHTACGVMIRVQSGPWQHVYCHLQGQVQVHQGRRYLVDREGGIILQQGQVLPTGARIARVGMTGRTTGPHLHWGLKHNGEYIDPARVLQAMLGA
ncbi:MAG: peptidoglycan DD-metalloendopeptidase family protein [Cyanobacteria bacterium RI_101]|nr:peptidoglycan DD-metalloendopeptidase family protein [Cyanobacteria bacterium RI_101]